MEKIPNNNEKKFEGVLNDFLAGEIDKTTRYLKENPGQILKFSQRAAYGYMGVITAGLESLRIFADHLVPSNDETLPQDIKDSVDNLIRTDVEGVLESNGGNVEIIIKKYSELISYLVGV